MHVVEVGQYFVTKDTGVFRQFQSVACREYTFSTKRVDPRKYENWACIRSHNQFFNTAMRSVSCLHHVSHHIGSSRH